MAAKVQKIFQTHKKKQKNLVMSKKSTTFAAGFEKSLATKSKVRAQQVAHNLATLAQLVEQRIRNA